MQISTRVGVVQAMIVSSGLCAATRAAAFVHTQDRSASAPAQHGSVVWWFGWDLIADVARRLRVETCCREPTTGSWATTQPAVWSPRFRGGLTAISGPRR